MNKALKIITLYPQEMNIYGDQGNVEYLSKRATLHGFSPEVFSHGPGDALPPDADIILGGGGQNSGQGKIAADLVRNAPMLKQLASDGIPMLAICGTYQLFGNYFETNDGDKIPGIGLFDLHTVEGNKRSTGNAIASRDGYDIIGYENHSGLTYLAESQPPFATVVKGVGNNGKDGFEGARTHNVFGSYLHGPVLPKNPRFADELLTIAVQRRYGSTAIEPVDEASAQKLAVLDSIAEKARQVASQRPH